MKGYKATYDMKCMGFTYEVGKTYSIDHMSICSHGFHFCSRMEDVLNYYSLGKQANGTNFVLLEVEALGVVQSQGISDPKRVTNKMKVIRVIPEEEYKHFRDIHVLNYSGYLIYDNVTKTEYKRNEKGMVLHIHNEGGVTYTIEYNDRDLITKQVSDGPLFIQTRTYEYDDRGNVAEFTVHNHCKENNRKTYETVNYSYVYDEKGNIVDIHEDNILCPFPEDRFRHTKRVYDDKNRMISENVIGSVSSSKVMEYDDNDNVIYLKRIYGDNLKVEYRITIE